VSGLRDGDACSAPLGPLPVGPQSSLPGGYTPTPRALRERATPREGLRGWQQHAYGEYFRQARRDFLLVATPGAGKTTYALTVARELLDRREIVAITVVTPTEHLKYQWARAATSFGIAIDSAYSNAQGPVGADFHGVAVTYAQVAAHPALHRQRTEARRTLVIFDEIHHAGDALSWGEAVREAFDPARRRLGLTGTPFRSDANPIPFVTYVPEPDGTKRSASDFVYGYGPALADGVVRPVIFLAYSGEMHWRTRAGDEITATLGTPMTKEQVAQAWRTALDPGGEWIQRVLEAADKRLTEVRREIPDAGGLVIAGDHETARAYAALLRRISGVRPVVVLSDDPSATKKISSFATSQDRWMVAVRMVSEGVDVPRLAVGVYATSVSTPLFFAQAVGRFVRARRRGETASVFLPSVPVLLSFAAELEAERDHVVAHAQRDAEDELAEAQRTRNTPDMALEGRSFEALKASAKFDRVLFDGGEFGTATEVGSPEEEDYLGLPGLLEPDQVAALLRKRQASQLSTRAQGEASSSSPAYSAVPSATYSAAPSLAATSAAPPAAIATSAPWASASASPASPVAGGQTAAPAAKPAVSRESLAALRKELNGLVGAWSHRTGQPHGVIHSELRNACGGPAIPQAGAEQIQARIEKIRQWALSRR
jgi:superfamily II DNA or RNA helicase